MYATGVASRWSSPGSTPESGHDPHRHPRLQRVRRQPRRRNAAPCRAKPRCGRSCAARAPRRCRAGSISMFGWPMRVTAQPWPPPWRGPRRRSSRRWRAIRQIIIVGAVEPVYRAGAGRAAFGGAIYLSSAGPRPGRLPPAAVDEDSVLSDRQPMAYNNAKVQAERLLAELRRGGAVETVVLRPGIDVQAALAVGRRLGRRTAGRRRLPRRGARAGLQLHLCRQPRPCDRAGGDLQDRRTGEPICWAIANSRPGAISMVQSPRRWASIWMSCQTFRPPAAAKAGAALPPGAAATFAAGQGTGGRTAAAGPRRDRRWLEVVSRASQPIGDRRTRSSRCRWSGPCCNRRGLASWARAEVELGYVPVVSFDEGLRRSIAWLEYAGYPMSFRKRTGWGDVSQCSGDHRPTYNHAHYLAAAIESALGQTAPPRRSDRRR